MSQVEQEQLDWLDGANAPEPIYVDRSTLERYMHCPAQGQMVEQKQAITASPEADAGNEVHQVISEIVKMVQDGHGYQDVVATAEDRLLHTRPDVQDEALEGLKRSLKGVVRMLMYHHNGEPRHPDDIVRFDGGEGEKSGQLAWDIFEHEGRPVRLTAEVDLLMASGSEEELDLIDYKSGRSIWSASDIQSSFQLGTFYPWLVMVNHPRLRTVYVRVWNTRINRIAGAVAIYSDAHFRSMHSRIEQATRDYLKFREYEHPPTRPSRDKCSRCPVAAQCPEARGDVREVVNDPQAAAKQLQVIEETSKQLRKALTNYTDKHGYIEVDGQWFGRDTGAKPPARKPAAKWHDAKEDESESEEGAE